MTIGEIKKHLATIREVADLGLRGIDTLEQTVNHLSAQVERASHHIASQESQLAEQAEMLHEATNGVR